MILERINIDYPTDMSKSVINIPYGKETMPDILRLVDISYKQQGFYPAVFLINRPNEKEIFEFDLEGIDKLEGYLPILPNIIFLKVRDIDHEGIYFDKCDWLPDGGELKIGQSISVIGE